MLPGAAFKFVTPNFTTGILLTLLQELPSRRAWHASCVYEHWLHECATEHPTRFIAGFLC
jgi:hypothetical protein